MFNSRFARLSLSLVASALTAVAVGCGGSNPMAPSTAAMSAAPGSQTDTFSASTRTIAQSASVTPTYYPGGGQTNYTCTDLAAMRGLEWFGDKAKLDQAPAGSHTVTDGVITVQVTNGTATSFNWTSNIPVDAVFVKSGKNGHNLYVYPGESTGGTGLTTPFIDNKYQSISHVNFCYDIELAVSKSASTTFKRDYDWSIAKSVNQPVVTVPDAGSATVNYSVAVTKDAGSDSDWAVSGTVTVTNPHPTLGVSGVTVSDLMTDHGAVTLSNCQATSLAPLASMTCNYATAVGNGSARTNTATADSTTYGIAQGQATAPVTFVTPTTVLDNAVNVTDTFAGAGLPAGAISDSQTFNYSRTFSAGDFSTCGVASQTTFRNTATIATDDGISRSANASVTATLTCPLPVIIVTPPTEQTSMGCAYSQGYWGQHSKYDGNKYNAVWANIGEDTPFYMSGRTYYEQAKLAAGGNAYNILANQFIAAKLNVFNGASAPQGINMQQIESFFSAYTPAYIAGLPSGSALRSQAIEWSATLDSYNNGRLNVPHCGS